MQQFFDEFEDYIKKKYGEKHFFKNLLEESVKPLHDTLEGITDIQVLEKIFGDIDTEKLQKAINELKLPSFQQNNNQLIAPEREEGLSKEAIPVFIKGIDKNILDALSSKSFNNVNGESSGRGGSSLAGVGGGAIAGGLAGIGAATAMFGGGMGEMEEEGFATSIKNSVNELLSIGETYDTGTLLARMGIISAGLVALSFGLMKFSLGTGAAVIASSVDAFSNQKIGTKPFALGIKDNVETLLSIGGDLDIEAGMAALRFVAVMTALGVGLAAFGIGGAISAITGLAKIGNEKLSGGKSLSEGIVYDVLMFLSLGTTENLKKVLPFIGVMAGTAVGLTAFSVGSLIASVLGLAKLGNAKLAGGEKLSDGIVYDVETLLGLGTSENLKKVLPFIGVMAGTAVGLAVFGIGSLIASLAGFAKIGNEKLSGGKSLSEGIVYDVLMFLSLGTSENLDTAITFTKVMVGIGVGLAVFGIGKGIEGGAATIDAILSFFTKESASERIFNDVSTLLSLGNVESLTSAILFEKSMNSLAKGLLKITAADVVGNLSKLASNTVNWITGNKSPLTAVMTIAENGDKLERGANALSTIAEALKELGKALQVGVDSFDFSKLATNLGSSIPIFMGLSKGGPVKIPWGRDLDFGGGLLDPELNFDKLMEAVSKMKYILGAASAYDSKSMSTPSQVKNKSDEFKVDSEELKNQKSENENLLRELLNDAIEAIGGATLLGANQVSETILATAGAGGGSTSNVVINSAGGDDIRKWRNRAVEWMSR